MDRRELLKMIALVTGSAFIGGEFLLTGCKSNDAKLGGMAFTESDIAFLDEVGETILPATKSPGAKAAQVGKYMEIMVNDCYDEADQKTFHEGIKKLDDASEKMFNTGFMKASPQQRHDLLVSLDKEAKEYQKAKSVFDRAENEKEKAEIAKGNKEYKKKAEPAHYFTMMKQLTLHGFFTSKVGATEALRHIAVPTKYEGCIPYKKGDRAWA
ncbi:MAG: gluconate 2-dehydrogenase subunit 3 family protein [Chitinophagaceae bacterium]